MSYDWNPVSGTKVKVFVADRTLSGVVSEDQPKESYGVYVRLDDGTVIMVHKHNVDLEEV